MKIQRAPYHHVDLHAAINGATTQACDGTGANVSKDPDSDRAAPFIFEGACRFTDREIWRRIDAKLSQLARDNRRSLSVLQIGCGSGTWLRRIVLRARALGFAALEIRGMDISAGIVARAQEALAIDDICLDARVSVGDVSNILPYGDGHFDVSLCLDGVLNHIPAPVCQSLAAELARVTGDTLFVTVRTAGSPPTIHLDGLEKSCACRQDNDADRMEVDMEDSRHLAVPSHLFTCHELKSLFDRRMASVALSGMDLFHTRFATDARWNPESITQCPEFEEYLGWLERHFASDPLFIDRAAQILLVGESLALRRPACSAPKPSGEGRRMAWRKTDRQLAVTLG